jgi:hypothetical protein
MNHLPQKRFDALVRRVGANGDEQRVAEEKNRRLATDRRQ